MDSYISLKVRENGIPFSKTVPVTILQRFHATWQNAGCQSGEHLVFEYEGIVYMVNSMGTQVKNVSHDLYKRLSGESYSPKIALKLGTGGRDTYGVI